MQPVEVALATAAVAAGACIQGSVGFGLGLLAAPLVALFAPELVPGPMLFVGVLLTVLVAHRERGDLDFRELKWAIIGRVPGTVVGALAVAALPQRGLSVMLALLVLTGVLLSVRGWAVEINGATLFTAGAASGFMGTATSVGGPPVALVYQRRRGPELRATMAAYFVFGATFSLVTLAVVGEFGGEQIVDGVLLVPGVVGGFFLSRVLARVLDRGYTRAAVLIASAASSLVLLVTELV